MSSVYFDAGITDEERRQRLYAGDIFIIPPSDGTRKLIALASRMLEEAFAPHDPRKIQEHMTAEEVAAVLSTLKPAFIHHPECKELLPQIMKEAGVDLDSVYFDVPRMRSAYPTGFLSSGIAYAFHPHRDTWYSAPMCQLNWWIPIYPVLPENGMAFYPRHFREPVANNSDVYNYYEWNTTNRASAAQNIKTDTRVQPKPQGPIDPVKQTYVPPPGGIILFSGAQLHETVENLSDVARYSIDFRTVNIHDARARLGAANIDSRSTGTTMRDYLRATDLAKLPEEVIALYDDETASGDKVLYFGDRLANPAATT
jgi:hypothetical protein